MWCITAIVYLNNVMQRKMITFAFPYILYRNKIKERYIYVRVGSVETNEKKNKLKFQYTVVLLLLTIVT